MSKEQILKEIELLSKPGGKDGRGGQPHFRLEKINQLVRQLIKESQQ